MVSTRNLNGPISRRSPWHITLISTGCPFTRMPASGRKARTRITSLSRVITQWAGVISAESSRIGQSSAEPISVVCRKMSL